VASSEASTIVVPQSKSKSFHKLFKVIRKLEGDVTVLSVRMVKRDLLVQYLVLKVLLKDFGITSKILGIILDNASNNNTFIEAFELYFTDISSSFTKRQAPNQENEDLNILDQANTSNTSHISTIKKLHKLITKLQHLPQSFNLIMNDLKEMLEKGLSSVINEAIEAALEKLKVYYAKSDSPIYAVTTLLDPRFKKAHYEHDYLAIPTTSAPSERLFSKDSNMDTKKHGSLNPETIQKAIALCD
ncbi:39_t:CDS:2, partial [Ambispora leptoticha]